MNGRDGAGDWVEAEAEADSEVFNGGVLWDGDGLEVDSDVPRCFSRNTI